MPTTPSPLRYPGGKTAYAPMLQQIIRDNNLNGCDYVEPFAGGAGAAITLLLSGSVHRIWLNDLDYAIYAFWKAILDHTEDFIALIKHKHISVSEWYRQRDIYHSDCQDVLIRGFATFYLNRCNRAGILAANPIGGLRQNGLYTIQSRFKKQILIDKIRIISNLRERIILSNKDACNFLSNFIPDNQKTLIYFDPPYYQKGGLLYMNYFTHADHKELCESIMNCHHAWILSYDDRQEIRTLYEGINTYQCNLRYTVVTPSIGKELIISDLIMPESLTQINEVNHVC
jgi:DNA adenine methylase